MRLLLLPCTGLGYLSWNTRRQNCDTYQFTFWWTRLCNLPKVGSQSVSRPNCVPLSPTNQSTEGHRILCIYSSQQPIRAQEDTESYVYTPLSSQSEHIRTQNPVYILLSAANQSTGGHRILCVYSSQRPIRAQEDIESCVLLSATNQSTGGHQILCPLLSNQSEHTCSNVRRTQTHVLLLTANRNPLFNVLSCARFITIQ